VGIDHDADGTTNHWRVQTAFQLRPFWLTDRNKRAYGREMFEGSLGQLIKDEMDSYPSCATAVAMSACWALIRRKQIAPGDWAGKFA
jgi:hypothetical protein